MGVPAMTAVLVTIVEFFGGVLLVLGLIVPVVGIFAALQFASIIVVKMTKMKAHYISMEPGKPSFEIDAFYLILAIALVVLGAGALSLDGLIF